MIRLEVAPSTDLGGGEASRGEALARSRARAGCSVSERLRLPACFNILTTQLPFGAIWISISLSPIFFQAVVMFSSLRLMSDHTEGRWYQYPGTTEPSIYREVVDRTFVMCWTLNEPSSEKMWSEYTKQSKGIASQRRLENSNVNTITTGRIH